MLDKLATIEQRYEKLTNLMSQPEVATDFDRLQSLAKERAAIENLVTKYRVYKATAKSLEETQALLENGPDEEMVALAREEVEKLRIKLKSLEQEIRVALLPRDP